MQDDVTKPVEGIEGGQCAKCFTLKPISEFKRKLSLLQSRAMGYTGDFPLEVVSKYCKACQPVQTPLRSMSKRRLAELVSQGVIPQVVADNALASRQKSASNKHEYAMMKREVQDRKAAWDVVLRPLNEELRVVIQQGKFSRTANDTFRIRYTDHYKKILVDVREVCKTKRDLRKEKPGDLQDWRQLVPVDDVRELLDVWRDIPSKVRVKMRMASLLDTRWRSHIGVTGMTEAAIKGRVEYQERRAFMDEQRARKEAERAEMLARGEEPPPPILRRREVTPRPAPPRLITAREREARARMVDNTPETTDDLLRSIGINPNKE